MARVGQVALLVVVLAAAVGAILLGRDAEATSEHLQAVQQELQAARAAFADGEVETGEQHVADAAAQIAEARVRTDGPIWDMAARVPRFGASAQAARGAVDLAGASTQLADEVAEQADTLLAEGAAAFVDDGGDIRTEELEALGERMATLPLDDVVEARDRLRDLPSVGLVGPVASGRDSAVRLADEAITTITRARDGVGALAGFLGGDGTRTYLLAVQNPGELRGTGGLISYLAEMRVEAGDLAVQSAGVTASDDPEDLLGRPGETGNTLSNLEPVERPAPFADRYDNIAGGAILQSVNADPDLPTVAPVLIDLYAARGGDPTDGVIMVDPVTLAHILDATGGPMDVPAEARAEADGLPEQLTADNLVETLTVTVYDAFGGSNPARRVFDEAVTLEVLERLTGGRWDPVELTRALADAAAGRHLQLYSTDEVEQAAFVDLGLAGRMPNDERGLDGDLLAVTGINAAANKQDTLVAHRMSGTIDLGAMRAGAPATVDRSGTLQVALANPVEPGRDTYISGSQPPRQIGSDPDPRVEDALNRTWFSVWTTPETEATEVREADERQLFRATTIHGHRVFDYFLETPSASTNSFEIDLDGRVELVREGDDVVYRLTLWRQAKAIPDHWDLTVTAPQGWEISEAAVEGGGAPTGMGAGGEGGRPLEASVEDGSARLVGAATTDAVLEVRLTSD